MLLSSVRIQNTSLSSGISFNFLNCDSNNFFLIFNRCDLIHKIWCLSFYLISFWFEIYRFYISSSFIILIKDSIPVGALKGIKDLIKEFTLSTQLLDKYNSGEANSKGIFFVFFNTELQFQKLILYLWNQVFSKYL